MHPTNEWLDGWVNGWMHAEIENLGEVHCAMSACQTLC